MTGEVRVQLVGDGARKVGRLTLDAPKTLNSLTLDMVEVLAETLLIWRDDPCVAAVFIDGAGDKAFCAGGDVQALRNSSLATPGGPCEYAENFFAREYRMNYLLHTYPKPIVCWGHGVVMGGGLGILAGCSHRVVSERTRIGMPEITIALFPDVGGSWFLNRMPGQVGRFLALTAANINATDALFAGLGSHFLGADQREAVVNQLAAQAWSDDADSNRKAVTDLLSALAPSAEQPAAQVEPVLSDINSLMAGDDLAVIVDRVENYSGENEWLQKAKAGLLHGSSLAACWIFRQLNETRDASLSEVFRSELRLGANVLRFPEFAEGVRALLVDKDRNPVWSFPDVRSVPEALIDQFFEEPEGAPVLELPE